MDGFYILLGFVAIVAAVAIPVSVIYLLISHSDLKTRVRGLEKRLAALGREGGTKPAAAAAPVKTSVPIPAKPAPLHDKKLQPAYQPKPEPTPPAAYVFRRDRMDEVLGWLKENWFFAVAAISLALAGIFLVQYGVEKGLLTPTARVLGAIGLGVMLIAGAEWIRRRGGDAEGDLTAYLPSTFAGAGLVAMFAGVLAARQLYGLVGVEAGFAGLVIIAVIAVGLGWIYGPLLAAAGILGGAATPFLVGGNDPSPYFLYYYFAVIVLTGLALDMVKRWAWVSTLALGLGFLAASSVFLGTGGPVHFAAFALVALAGAVILPERQLRPTHGGATLTEAVFLFGNPDHRWPEFPTRLVAGSFAAATLVAMLILRVDEGEASFWLAIMLLGALILAATIWFRDAPALQDLAALPVAALMATIALQALDNRHGFAAFQAGLMREAESAAPLGVSALVVLGLIGSALAFWRGLRGGTYAHIWSIAAALLASVLALELEFFWKPASVMGTAPWAMHAMAIAFVMSFWAERLARVDGTDRRRVAYFALSALTMIAFALILLLSSVALTLALAVMVLGAAVLDRRLNLWLLTIFAQIGAITTGWRLVLDPGLGWALKAPLWELLLNYGGSIGLLAAAWFALQQRARIGAIVVMESAVWSLGGILATVLLYRALEYANVISHWSVSLFAMIWLISSANQLYRLRAGGRLRLLRVVLAAVFGAVGLIYLVVAQVFTNPLTNWGEPVLGWPVIDTLAIAYLLPAALLAGVAWKFAHLVRPLRLALGLGAAALVAIYVGLEIRHLWQGPVLYARPTTQGEIYSYTVAMLLCAVALMFVAFTRRSIPLRRVAIVVVGLTIAKVFLVDMGGLTGLIRVVSFLGLGLSLAGLAWVNRWMTLVWEKGSKT